MRRGQSGNEAWVVIGLITLLLIFYILFLPPAERQKLLDDSTTYDSTTDGSISVANNTLLKERVGTLEAHEPIITHSLPASRIYESKKAVVFDEPNAFYVKRGWFSRKDNIIDFGVPDLANSDNIMLAYDTTVRTGILTVTLNEKVIFEGQIPRSPAPIRLRKDLLQKDNTLRFSVNNVGFAFWSSNEIDFTNVKIIGDVSDVTRQKAQNVFAVSPVEKNNVVTATLEYTAECDEASAGPLSIMINDQRVYQGVPDCGGKNRAEINSAALQEGSNALFFETTKGDYYLSGMKLTTLLKKTRSFIGYFDVSDAVVQRAKDNTARVMLEIDFVDDKLPKRAQVNVNGHLTFIDQVEPFYAKNLNAFVLSGPRNYIEVIPESSIGIPELRVVVK